MYHDILATPIVCTEDTMWIRMQDDTLGAVCNHYTECDYCMLKNKIHRIQDDTLDGENKLGDILL